MAVLEPLVTSLQLAGLPYADIQHSLEQACSDKSTAEVLHWLGSTAAKQLISHGLALQSATQQSESQRSLQPCLPPTTITAMVKDQEGQALLQPDLVTAGLQESIQDKESSLLLHQDQLSRLRRLSIAANTQATSSQQAAAKHHQQELQQRRNKTKQHLDAQQAALNQVLTDVQKTASSLCFTAEQHIQGSCLALSDLTSLQRESAALNQAIERLYIEQTQGSAAASMQPQHVDLTQRHDGNVPQFDFLASVLKGPDSQKYEEHVQELERLRWVHEVSQMQHVTTLAWQAKQEAMLATLKASVTRRGAIEEPMLMQTELNHLTAELQRLTAHKQKLLADLPTLCSLSASLQDTHVLHEDYNAKLLRQQHCIAKQKTIVRLLIEQHARQQLLCLARDAEVERLQSLMQELQLLLEVLKGAKDASQQRIASYIGQELESDAEPKLVVHNSDSFLQTLHGVLSSRPADSSGPPNSSNSSKAHLYVTVAQLKSQLGQLASSSEVSSSHQHAEDMHKQIAASLQASFGSLHTLLFPESSIAAVQLTAPELHEALQKAQSASTDLTKAVQQVTQKQQMYQNLLSQQRVQLEAEQQVFSRFHTNPETLHELCSGM